MTLSKFLQPRCAVVFVSISLLIGCSESNQNQALDEKNSENNIEKNTPSNNVITEVQQDSAQMEEIPDSPVDPDSAKRIEDSLMSTMLDIGVSQDERTQQGNVDDLQELTESQRQALIDLTDQQSTQITEQDAQTLSESLEKLKEIEHAPLEVDTKP